jgi:acyl-CoA synthetase (AMP-forming)/AMP-acid ligase II
MREPALWDLVERRAARTPDGGMLVDENGRHVTFGQFTIFAERLSASLAARGICSGQVISWQLPTTVETLILVAALARLGVIQNPVIPAYGSKNLEFVTRQAGSSLVITPENLRSFLPGDDPLEAPAAALSEDGDGDPVRWIFYTSGTTAEPKGARHTDASVLASAVGLTRALELSETDRAGMVFPVAHIGGCGTWLGACLLSGCTLILDSRFDLERTADLQRREGVTVAGAGTVFTQLYLDLQRRRRADRRDPGYRLFPSARMLTAGAAPRPPSLHDQVKGEMGGIGVPSGYGMTEAPILTMGSVRDPDPKLAATEGRACPGVSFRVVDGELRVKGPQVMRGYVDPALDADAFDADGYLRTGDLGSVDDDGYVTITGRIKDVIIRKGETISARAVELELLGCPGVADAAVVAIPDAVRGELACALVVPADLSSGSGSGTGSPLTLDSIVAHLRERGVAPAQWPERLEVVPDFPRTSTGKVRKDDLRARLLGASQ